MSEGHLLTNFLFWSYDKYLKNTWRFRVPLRTTVLVACVNRIRGYILNCSKNALHFVPIFIMNWILIKICCVLQAKMNSSDQSMQKGKTRTNMLFLLLSSVTLVQQLQASCNVCGCCSCLLRSTRLGWQERLRDYLSVAGHSGSSVLIRISGNVKRNLPNIFPISVNVLLT